jgi:hypothetical protein
MDPTPFSQKLCALRDNGPSFLGEANRVRNNSHSPQPPIRKRLYSEDFNTILQEVPTQKLALAERRKTCNFPEPQQMVEPVHQVFEDPKVFLEELPNVRTKRMMFSDHVEKLDDVNRSYGEMTDFDRDIGHLREESQDEEDGGIPFLHQDLGKQEDKQKDHFEGIFDSGRKDKVEGGFLGKRDAFELEGISGKNSAKKMGMVWERRSRLKVEENTAYVFKSQKMKLSVGPMQQSSREKETKKKEQSKVRSKGSRRSLNGASQKKRESTMTLERKALQMQG